VRNRYDEDDDVDIFAAVSTLVLPHWHAEFLPYRHIDIDILPHLARWVCRIGALSCINDALTLTFLRTLDIDDLHKRTEAEESTLKQDKLNRR
jgi:hypothetical protein